MVWSVVERSPCATHGAKHQETKVPRDKNRTLTMCLLLELMVDIQ